MKVIESLKNSFLTHAGIYFHDCEITPSGQEGVYLFDKNGTSVETFPPEVEVRAIIESQFLAKLSHAKNLGYEIGHASRVLATGGAAVNTRILQVSTYNIAEVMFMYSRCNESSSSRENRPHPVRIARSILLPQARPPSVVR